MNNVIYIYLVIHTGSKSKPYHSVVVSSWSMTPETIGPRIIARPCPANPKDMSLTPMYSVGMIVLFSGFLKIHSIVMWSYGQLKAIITTELESYHFKQPIFWGHHCWQTRTIYISIKDTNSCTHTSQSICKVYCYCWFSHPSLQLECFIYQMKLWWSSRKFLTVRHLLEHIVELPCNLKQPLYLILSVGLLEVVSRKEVVQVGRT